jgi:hypothetical protein
VGSDAPDLFKQEIAFFDQIKNSLLEKCGGQFVLIKGNQLVGTFTTFEEAYDKGVTEFGQEPFLIKQLVAQEPQEMQPALFQGLLRADF